MKRTCVEPGCGTLLSAYNDDLRCRRHARPYLVDGRVLQENRPTWQVFAECAGHDTELWFPETDGSAASSSPDTALYALSLCGLCPVRRECLEWAFRHEAGYRSGIFGGVTGAEREEFARRPDRITALLRIGDDRYRRHPRFRRKDGQAYLLALPEDDEEEALA